MQLIDVWMKVVRVDNEPDSHIKSNRKGGKRWK